jgi:hypothetical protein
MGFLLFKYENSTFVPDLNTIQNFNAFHNLWTAERKGPLDPHGINKIYNMLDLRLVSYMSETSRKVNKFAALPEEERWVAVKTDLKYDRDTPETNNKILAAIKQYKDICNHYYPINRNLNSLEITLSENAIFFENLNEMNKQLLINVQALRDEVKKAPVMEVAPIWQNINILNSMINDNMTKSTNYATQISKAINVINSLKTEADAEREKEIILVGNKRKGNREDPK